MVAQLTRTNKEQLDRLNRNLRDEINTLRASNAELSGALQHTKASLERAEAELKKERNLKLSSQGELNNAVTMHEKEFDLRLRFEAKLNNLASM